MSKIETLAQCVIGWADSKGILTKESSPRQFLKIIEESGETCQAILKNDMPSIIDGIGDIAVTIIIYSEQTGNKIDYKAVFYNFRKRSHNEIVASLLSFIIEGHPKYAFSTLHELAESFDLSLEECLEAAWNEIKDRKGKTVNGVFVKD
jgi:phosphoribosyl-ATP pyrophosphohydrolase